MASMPTNNQADVSLVERCTEVPKMLKNTCCASCQQERGLHQCIAKSAPLMLKNRLSDNFGGVKHFSSVLIRALARARHFALVEELPYQPRLARNRFQVRN